MSFLFTFLVVCSIYVIRAVINVSNDRAWNHNLFEQERRSDEGYSHDPLLEAYISIGALMVRKDRASYREKILYLNSYFSKHFPDSHYDFGRSFTESLKNPLRTKTISNRLRRKLPQKKQRLQVMYFLAGLATVDGSMNKREIDLLKQVNTLLKLSTKDFDTIIAIYTQKKERNRSHENTRSKVSAKQLASKVLGVAEGASQDEVKKAYRRLVKLHHPDVFANESEAQQEIAEKRFIEIQKAYEILELQWN